jgi:hypothetical protein
VHQVNAIANPPWAFWLDRNAITYDKDQPVDRARRRADQQDRAVVPRRDQSRCS